MYVLGSRIARIGRAKGHLTPADMISDYYNSPAALRLLVALIGFLYAVPYVVLQIRAGGFLAQQMFSGQWSFEIGASALALIAMVYIMFGGMRSVAWTDVIQGLLLIGGMLLGGIAVVAAFGGLAGFFEAVRNLPPTSLSVPGTTASWPAEKLFTVCMFASLGSMIQPAQWMRYYAARSTNTLRRSAVIFAVLLTACFLFGVILVGLGGQALYPLHEDGQYRFAASAGDRPTEGDFVLADPDQTKVNWDKLLSHPRVGTRTGEFDQIMMVVLKEHLPVLLGPLGPLMVALLLVAIAAASMSTADSNLHALSAVLTHDVWDRFVRPNASEYERKWVGRGIIAGATVLALVLVIVSRHVERFNPVAMIVPLMVLAIAFSSQLIPVTLDMLFLRRGTRAGAIAGMIVGLAIVFLFSPLLSILTESLGIDQALAQMKKTIDVGAWGLLSNLVVFVLVGLVTRPPDQQRVAEYERLSGSPW